MVEAKFLELGTLKYQGLDLNHSKTEEIGIPESKSIITPLSASPNLKSRRTKRFRGLSISSREESPFNPKSSEYYQLRIPEDAPAIECRICEFLNKNQVRMSHPSEKKKSKIISLQRRFSMYPERSTVDTSMGFSLAAMDAGTCRKNSEIKEELMIDPFTPILHSKTLVNLDTSKLFEKISESNFEEDLHVCGLN